MSRLQGTLAPRTREGRYGGNHNGLTLDSILAGANREDTAAFLEMQGCAKYLLAAVNDYSRRKAHREDRERAMMLATWKVMHRG